MPIGISAPVSIDRDRRSAIINNVPPVSPAAGIR